MKKFSDGCGVAFALLFVLAVLFFPFDYGLTGLFDGKLFHWTGFRWSNLENFRDVTNQYPYLMGFFKFALLATFGEMLKNRLKTGNWSVSMLPARAAVWGIFGMVMALAFGLFAGGVGDLMSGNLWFGSNPKLDTSFGNTFLFAITTSLWMNLIFAYPMMLAHEWCNQVIAHRKLLGGREFFAGLSAQVWGSFIPKTIVFFWIPAHTVTFLLPPEFRVLTGAALGVALGFILTVNAKKA